MTNKQEIAEGEQARTSRRRSASEISSNCNYDPGGFGRALRSREESERVHQDTGFYGSFLGWESGTSPATSMLQSHGHQWRLRASDMTALDMMPPVHLLAPPHFLRAVSNNARSESPLPIGGVSSKYEVEENASTLLSEENNTPKNNDTELRSATETWRAIETGFFIPCECTACHQRIFCIQNAKSVHCPHCKEVSPLAGEDKNAHGLGLGFSLEYLVRSQNELLQVSACPLETKANKC